MKKKKTIFYKVYFSALAIFALVLICFLAFLFRSVGEYNKGLAETVSQNYFDELFMGKNYDKIFSDSGFENTEFETMSSAENRFSQLLDGKLSYTSITSKHDNIKEYIVKSDDRTIASFSLVQDERNDYVLKSLDLSESLCDITVKTLDSSKLYLNGILVSDKYISLTEPHEYAEQLEGYAEIPQYTTYTIKGFANIPEITIKDRNGKSADVQGVNGAYVETILSDSDDELGKVLLSSAKEYAKCMQNEVGKAQALMHFVRGSEIYEIIRGVETSFAWDHNGSFFTDETISEFFRYDENTVSAKISFNHVLKLNGKSNHIEPFEKTIFATSIDGKYQIFAMK